MATFVLHQYMITDYTSLMNDLWHRCLCQINLSLYYIHNVIAYTNMRRSSSFYIVYNQLFYHALSFTASWNICSDTNSTQIYLTIFTGNQWQCELEKNSIQRTVYKKFTKNLIQFHLCVVILAIFEFTFA